MKYSNFETLKKNSDFKKVYNKKISYANKYLVMYILENGTDTVSSGTDLRDLYVKHFVLIMIM